MVSPELGYNLGAELSKIIDRELDRSRRGFRKPQPLFASLPEDAEALQAAAKIKANKLAELRSGLTGV